MIRQEGKGVEREKSVEESLSCYMGGETDMNEGGCDIESGMITFNFNFTAGEEYLYCEEDIRKLADALNYLLGDIFITGYTPFNSGLLERAGFI